MVWQLHNIPKIFLLLTVLHLTIWKELQQLQPQDQHFQQPRTRKALIQIPPPLDEFLTEVREQLTIFSSTEQASPIQEIQQECCDSQVFEMEQLFSNTEGASAKVREPSRIQLPTRIPQENTDSPLRL